MELIFLSEFSFNSTGAHNLIEVFGLGIESNVILQMAFANYRQDRWYHTGPANEYGYHFDFPVVDEYDA